MVTAFTPPFHFLYHISLAIRWSFSFQNNPKNLDPSYKMDLDLWDCLGRVYRIYLDIRRGFHLSRMTKNNLISSM